MNWTPLILGVFMVLLGLGSLRTLDLTDNTTRTPLSFLLLLIGSIVAALGAIYLGVRCIIEAFQC